MADDRMRNDDLDRNTGGAGQNKGDYGQQSPGRHKQDDDLRTGQRRTGQGQQNQPGQKKDEFGDDFGTGSNIGQGGQGGRNR